MESDWEFSESESEFSESDKEFSESDSEFSGPENIKSSFGRFDESCGSPIRSLK